METHNPYLSSVWRWVTHPPYVYCIPILVLFCVVIDVIANWRLVSKTGNAGVFSLLFYVPCFNIFLWLALAFGEWSKRDA